MALLVLVWALCGGCPSRFDPRAETLGRLQEVRAADPALDAAWREARGRYDAGDFEAARQGFAALRARSEAVASAASLWEARCQLALGDAAAARALVEPLAGAGPAASPPSSPPVSSSAPSPAPSGDDATLQARFLLGLSLARQGEAARSRELLLPLGASIVDGDDAVELHAALAADAAALGDTDVAFAELERFHEGARAAERAWVRDRAAQLAAALPDDRARVLFDASGSGSLARAVLGDRLAARVADPTGARSLREEARRARERFGFPVRAGTAAAPSGTPMLLRAVGVVLPLSGRSRLLGERALRGALLAAGAVPASPASPGSPSPAVFTGGEAPALLVRDTGSRPERAAAAVEELAAAGVAFVVLSPDRAEAAAAAARAEALGVPAFDLSLDEGAGSPGRFRLLRPNAARATALATRAVRAGARRVATLYPEGAYGRRMADAFVAAAQAAGATVVAQLHFEEKATTFIAPAKKLAELSPDAVFVPAAAAQLELIAAQLATLGVTRGASGRGAALYATADGAGPRMLANAGRYLAGAVLAPVFLASDASSPFPSPSPSPSPSNERWNERGDERGAPGAGAIAGSVVERYRAAFGEEPGAADALGFDAVSVGFEAIGRLPPDALEAPVGRRALAQLVSSGALRPEGLTGPIAFSPDGQRGGSPRLWTIDGGRVKVVP